MVSLGSNVIEKFVARFNGVKNGQHVIRDVICKGVVEKDHDDIVHVLYYKDMFKPSIGHFLGSLFSKDKITWTKFLVNYDQKDKEGRYKYPFESQKRYDPIKKRYIDFRNYSIWVDGTVFDINTVQNSSLLIENDNVTRNNNILKEQLADARRDNYANTTDTKFKKRTDDEATFNQKIRGKLSYSGDWANRID